MIIGRTDNNAENRSNINALSRHKYFVISHLVRDFMIQNDIQELPVCLNNLLKKNNWGVVSYTKLRKLKISEYDEIMKNNLGFVELNKDGRYIIFYNDEVIVERQRFTIAHEIGHILLNHFNVPIENREQEANMFAARLLMPICVLYECNIESIDELKRMCKVSSISAFYRYNRLEMLKERNKFYTDKNEVVLRRKFKKFIKNYLKLK